MKYSNYIGSISCVLLIASCFMPWVYIPPVQATLTGFNALNTNYGRPGLFHVVLSLFMTALFLLPAVWAKRTLPFVAVFNLAWATRNYLIMGRCELGECPEKKIGLYLILIFSLVILIMSLLPKVKVTQNKA